MADAQKKVDDLIKDHAVMIFSKVTCPHCAATKELFKQKGVQAHVLELDTKGNNPTINFWFPRKFSRGKALTNWFPISDDGYELQQALKTTQFKRDKETRTVPQTFVLTQLLGGNSDVQLLEEERKLDKELQDERIKRGPLVTL